MPGSSTSYYLTSFDEEIDWELPVVDEYGLYRSPTSNSKRFVVNVFPVTRNDPTIPSFPLVQPDIKFNVFKRLKDGEGKSYQNLM